MSRQTHAFTGKGGPRITIPSLVKEIFFLFFTSSVLDIMVQETNRYASTCLGDRSESWTAVTTNELCAYMGCMILMGFIKLPSLRDYWKKDRVFRYPPIADVISRDRFLAIHHYLHFTNNETLSTPGSVDHDKLGKIRPIITALSERFAAIYEPGMNISIDEAMIPFKGRSTMKQYVPLKPVKRGFKVWLRAEAENGYVSAFDVYTGKKGQAVEHGLGARVVKELSSDLHHTYRHLYFDNFFSSVDLLLDLWRTGLYGCGTMRTNRKGFPKLLKCHVKKGLAVRGDSITVQHKESNTTVSLWQDSRPVIVIANNTDGTVTETVKRMKKNGTRETYPCPSSIALYNRFMGGVDRNDQIRGYYNTPIKCRKFYKYIFWFLFDVAITNAFILCKEFSSLEIRTVKSFRVELAKQLIGDYNGRKRTGRVSTTATAKRFCQSHFPTRGSDQVHRCHYCSKFRKERRATVWFCKDCSLFLCHNGTEQDCFFLFHTHHGPICEE